jgi:cell division protein FtsQ
MKWWKSIKLWALLTLLIAGVMLVWAKRKFYQQNLVGIQAEVYPKQGLYFYRTDQIVAEAEEYLQEGQWLRRASGEVPIPELEAHLASLPGIRRSEVNTDLAQNLHIKVWLQEPILRVEPNRGPGYYIDRDGERFPVMDQYTAHVPIAGGNISEDMDSIVYTLGVLVHENPFWKAQVEQIFVDKANSIVIVPKWGNHRILLGKGEDLEGKLKIVRSFYQQALNTKGWDKYKEIDVRYNGKIYGK